MNLKRILAMMLCLCLMLACVPVVGVPVQATTEKQYVTIEAENTEYAVWNRYTKVESNAMYSGGAAAAGAPSGIYPYWDNASDSTEDLSANFLDKSNTPYVAYYVEAPADGTYSIKMKAQILPSSSVDKRFEDTGLYYGAFYVNGKSYPALYANSTDYANSVKGKNLTTQETQVELVKGMNTIICVGITEEQDYNSSNSCWSNIDCLMVEDSLTPVKTQENIIYAGDAPYVYGYTTVNPGSNVGDGGWGDNTIPISNMSTSNVEKLRSFTYTVSAPQAGYYDITAEYDGAGNGSDTRAIGLLVDGVPYAYEFKHLDNTNTSGGRVNLGVYLTAGDHVLTFTAPAKRTSEDDCGTGDASTTKNVSWFNYNEIYLYMQGQRKLVIQPVTAQVLATEENGDPALLCNCYGKGKIYFLGFGLEQTLCVQTGAFEKPYYKLYEYLFKADVNSVVTQKNNPLLGITEHPLPEGGWAVTVINYGTEPVEETLTLKNSCLFCGVCAGNVSSVTQDTVKVSLTAGEMCIFTVK